MPVQAIPLALAAAFFPAGLVVLTLLVARDPFIGRALAFLAGAMAMTFGCGLLVVIVAQGAGAAGGSGDRSLSGAVDIALGLLLLAAAVIVKRRPPKEGGGEQKEWVHRLMRSPTLAFVLGAAMYAPSPLYLGALKTVADAGLSTAGEILWVALLTVIVTSLIEIPVVLLVREPDKGRRVLDNLNGWMSRNGRTVVIYALAGAGLLLLVRGLLRVL